MILTLPYKRNKFAKHYNDFILSYRAPQNGTPFPCKMQAILDHKYDNYRDDFRLKLRQVVANMWVTSGNIFDCVISIIKVL